MERRPATVGAEGRWQQVEGDGVHSSALLVVQIGRRWQGGCVLKAAVRRRVGAASFEEGGDSVEFQRGQAARGQGGVLGQSDDRGANGACLQLAWTRGGYSGSGSSWRSIRCEDTHQAGVRVRRRLAGVRRPCGATVLRTIGRTDELR